MRHHFTDNEVLRWTMVLVKARGDSLGLTGRPWCKDAVDGTWALVRGLPLPPANSKRPVRLPTGPVDMASQRVATAVARGRLVGRSSTRTRMSRMATCGVSGSKYRSSVGSDATTRSLEYE